VGGQAGEQAKGRRELGHLGLAGEQDLVDQPQPGFQRSGSRGSSKPGDLIRSATDWVPW
jgi:hypothetical protein